MTIWTNDLNYDDWKADMEEQYPDEEGYTEDDRVQFMYELNEEQYNDERDMLNMELGNNIVMIADLGLWNGRRGAYKILSSTNLKDALTGTCGDIVTFYVEGDEFKCKDVHHDGTNHYIYHVLKPGVTKFEFEEDAYESFEDAIKKHTEPIGWYVNKIYGLENKNVIRNNVG